MLTKYMWAEQMASLVGRGRKEDETTVRRGFRVKQSAHWSELESDGGFGVLALSLSSCVILGKLLNISGLHVDNGDHHSTYLRDV